MPELRLTFSGRYYVRNYKGVYKVDYYDLNKKRIPLAKATCNKCKETIKSLRCGHFVQCSCNESFVDTDRWFPELHRYGGDCTIIT